MSQKLELLQVCPDKGNEHNKGEVFAYNGFECPECDGQGFFNQSGWISKFKANYEDPDFKECKRCKGTGRLQAKVVIGWMAENLPSNLPKCDSLLL